MADCIQARITQNILDTLKDISVLNGYNTNIACAERLRTVLEINNRYPYALLIENAGDNTEEFTSGEQQQLHYLIWYFDSFNDNVTGTPDVDLNSEFTYRMRNVAADITKALKIDVTRGGLAQYTKRTQWDYGIFVDNNMALPGVYVLVDVDIFIDQNDPYKLA